MKKPSEILMEEIINHECNGTFSPEFRELLSKYCEVRAEELKESTPVV